MRLVRQSLTDRQHRVVALVSCGPEVIVFDRIMRAVLAQSWAIDPDSLAWAAICEVLTLRASGGLLSEAEIQARLGEAAAANGPRSGGRSQAGVAVIPIYGVISPRAGSMGRASGGTTAEDIGHAFSAALRDPEVGGIVLDVDSPGGAVQGIAEVAAQIRAARGVKPVAAIANHTAASAAYWIAAQADEVLVTPSGQVGSIGVIGAHQDISEAQAKLGVKTTLVTAGKFKGEGNEFEPLSDEARAEMQARTDAFYRMFVSDVAKGRGVGMDAVRSGYGQGRTLLAGPAVESGMADRIGTLDEAVRRVAGGKVISRPSAGAPAALGAISAEDHHDPDHTGADGMTSPDGSGTGDAEGQDPSDGASDPNPLPLRVLPARRIERLRSEAAHAGGYELTR